MKQRHLYNCTALVVVAAFLVVGCWGRDGRDVEQVMDDLLREWNRFGFGVCSALPDGAEREACLLEHREKLSQALSLREELRVAFANCNNGRSWAAIMDSLGDILRDLSFQASSNFASPLGAEGRVLLNIEAHRSDEGYVIPEGGQSSIGWGFGRGGLTERRVRGSFALTLNADGEGGFTGTVDAFEIVPRGGGLITLALGEHASRVTIGPDGRGTLRFQCYIEHGFLPTFIPWWIELPVETAGTPEDPLSVITIRTDGEVSSEEIFPVAQTPDDCNQNGVSDDADIQDGASQDCNGDGIPDECQWELDWTGNGTPDECEIESGILQDRNENGIPDDFEVWMGGVPGEGAEISLPTVLIDGGMYPWDIQPNGRIGRGRWWNGGHDAWQTFGGALLLRVGGEAFQEQERASLHDGGQTVVLGPSNVAGLEVTREVFVPPRRAAFVRYIEILHNPTNSPVSTAVTISCDTGAYPVVTSSGDASFGTEDTWATFGTWGPQTVGFALAGAFGGIGASYVGLHDFYYPIVPFSWTYDVTVPPGRTVALMHFAVQRIDPDDCVESARALSELEDPTALEHLTADLRASIVNFPLNPDWVGDTGDVDEATIAIIRGWHSFGLQICNSIMDEEERAACLLEHRRVLGRATWLREELLAEYGDSYSDDEHSCCEGWKRVIRALSELARQTPGNFGSPLGEGGRIHLNVTTRREGGEYVVQDGSEIGWGFGNDPVVFQSVSGGSFLTLNPDGNGGFTGTLDAFELRLEEAGDRTGIQISLAPDGQPGSVTIDPGGQGTMQFRGLIDNEYLPPDFPWWFEVPIETSDRLVTIEIRSGGEVPGEAVFPVRSSDGDCNGNGVLDETDIQEGTSADCNGDGVPDECQWDSDFNGNGFPDECDIQSGASSDVNENGIADESEARLVRAFAFGSRFLECPTGDPRVQYTMVHHAGQDMASRDALAYQPGRGWGYEITQPGDPSRGGFGQFGPFAEVPVSREKFTGDCPEGLYDSFIGASNFALTCYRWTVGDPDEPCQNGGMEPEGLVFRVDIPNGRYRFVGAFGDAANTHAHRILVEDGGVGPPGAIGENFVTLVRNFDQAQETIGQTNPLEPGAGSYAAVGFTGRFPPPGDGISPDPQFVYMNVNGLPSEGIEESPTLKVTQGYIRVHQLQGNSNAGPGGPRNPDGGDMVLLEIWKRTAYAGTITVARDGMGDYTEIQLAIDAAVDANTIVVKPGEYELTWPITFRGRAITVRAEVGPEDTVIRMRTADRSVVVFANGDRSVLEGFTLTGGSVGVYCRGASSPTLTSCTISGNSSNDAGGGVYCEENSSPTLTSCTISGNSANNAGGGVCCEWYSSATITSCTISGNSASNRGGGVCCGGNSSATITNCTISGNSADEGGGVWWVNERALSPTLTNCTISGNSASNQGGGVYCGGYSSATITNCTISGNSASNRGGGVCCGGYSSATITNCTISGNSASNQGGGVYCWGLRGSLTLTNCIIWHNVGGSISVNGGSTPPVTFSSIESDEVSPGVGNINEDPLFRREGLFDFGRFLTVELGGLELSLPDFIVEAPDYYLRPGSPAIDVGTADGATAIDIEGIPRPQGEGVDMGACEFYESLPDCNENGTPDVTDIFRSTSADCNENGVPDECDIAAETSLDCNLNGVPDECDIAAETSLDCNVNGVPDECDIAAETSLDCNLNDVPDECDVDNGTSLDANGNNTPDECELLFLRGDINGDGSVPGTTTDIVFLANFLFLGDQLPPCMAAADVNGDGAVPGTTTDIVFLASFLFLGGAEPPVPGPRECGPGNESDEVLGCFVHPCQD